MANLPKNVKLNDELLKIKNKKHLFSVFNPIRVSEVGFLVALLMLVVLSFLFFYYWLPNLLSRLNVVHLQVFF